MRPIDHFDTAAEQYAARVALQDTFGRRLTFSELQALSERIAAVLQKRCNHSPLPRIAIYSPNDVLAVACTIAIMRAGGVVVPIHGKDSPQSVAAFLSAVAPQCVLFHGSLEKAVAAIRPLVTSAVTFVCLDQEFPVEAPVDAVACDRVPFVDDWGDRYGNPDRPVYIRQTSGTSGAPKIVVVNVAAFDSTHMVHRAQLGNDGRDQVCLVAAPFSHAAGVHAFAMLTLGATLVVLPQFDPVDVLQAIARYRVTHLWLPATSLYLLTGCQSTEAVDCSSLRSIVVGASGVAIAKLKEAVGRFGGCISVNYSQIEGGFVTWLDAATIAAAVAGNHPERLASSGRSVLASRIGIMSDDGQLVGRGTVGEIVLRGHAVKPFITKPYVEDSKEMEASGRHGWHHTGDLGFLDADGYLYVVGRLKDNVVVGGFKVSCAEVEAAILELPAIAECAVFAVPDEYRGEAVKAIVRLRDHAVATPSEVILHCRSRLGAIKCPASVDVWPVLPKTAVGKLDKRGLRAEYLNRIAR